MPSGRPHVILIDGESGAGKTTLANVMQRALGATVVHLDDVYTGWDGLIAGRNHVIASVVHPLVKGLGGSHETWDWELSEPGNQVTVEPCDVLIIEGCGISTPESRALADVTIWLNCDEEIRRERLRHRDGAVFDEFTQLWEDQVANHIIENDPIRTASVRLSG